MQDVRLVIAVPSNGNWDPDFCMSLIFFTNYLATHGEIDGKPIQFRIHNKRGSILANSRQSLVQQAVEGRATHLLFIDSDQTFPADVFHRLYEHKKGIVGCNIATKMLPSTPTARLKGNGNAGVPLYTQEDSTGLQRVWRLGTGVMLIKLSIFQQHGMEKPWFTQRWSEELEEYVGEDWAFCEKLEAAGIGIFVDQDLSKEIGHVGRMNYGHDAVEVDDASRCREA